MRGPCIICREPVPIEQYGAPDYACAWLKPRLADAGAALLRQQDEATEDHQSIRNAITTLRALDQMDWRQIFADTCAAMQVMAGCAVHAAEREDCQDDTMHAIERLAVRGGLAEAEVARILRALAAQAAQAGSPEAAPAYWWNGPGRDALHRALDLRPALWRSDSAPWRHRAAQVYLLALAALTAGGVAWVMRHHGPPGAGPGLLLLTTLLLLGPVSEMVVAVSNRWISESVRPRRLPRLALEQGIPAEHRVMVVMPSMLTSVAAIQALAAQLEQHGIANPQAEAQFALLTDWADADQATRADDDTLLAAAEDAVRGLNRQYPTDDGEPPRFLLLHRPREWSETEQRHIGWERKRGKLEQLLAWLARADGAAGGSPFIDLGPLRLVLIGLLSESILPSWEWLAGILGVAAVVTIVLWKWFVRLHTRLQVALIETMETPAGH